MQGINSFNIRVYGLCIQDNKLLVLHEEYVGEKLIKLPGGGMEYGEGTIDCLKREFMEEINLSIKSVEHFYTQEDFVQSKFKENEQLLTIYYLVQVENMVDLEIKIDQIECVEWLPIENENPFELPVDKIVFERLQSIHS